MVENFKAYLTKRNIVLSLLILVCVFFIFKIALGLIFPSQSVSTIDETSSKNVVEGFIKTMSSKKEMDPEKYMVKGWKEEEVKRLIMGYKDIESLDIKEIKINNYEQYCAKYASKREGDREYVSFTVALNHNYKEKSKYKDEVKDMVFILEKENGKWRIATLGTRAIISSII